MKKKYVKLSFEVVLFSTSDIVTASRVDVPEDKYWNEDFGEFI